MIKKYNYKIAGIASFAGFAINNVKAANIHVYVNIGGTNYFDKTKNQLKKEDITTFNALFTALGGLTGDNKLKKDGNKDVLDLKYIKKNYFVKSVKIGEDEKLTNDNTLDIHEANINDDDKKLTVELVKKEDRINITYDNALNGARLKKTTEEVLLINIIQGEKISELFIKIKDIVPEFKIGNVLQNNKDEVIGGKDIKLFEGDAKIAFQINNISASNLKTVVCKFGTGVEEKLVAGLDLEKLCDATEITKEGKKLSEEINALNEVDVKDGNKGIFKSNANLAILPDGDNSKQLVENTKNIPNHCSFIVINGITENDINPKFLKKKFTVEFVKGDDNKTVSEETINHLNDKLKEELENTVNITGKVIFNTLKKVTEIYNTFTGSIDINTSSVPYNDNNVLNTTNDFTIKLKSDIFADTALITKIKVTCDFSSINKDLKEVFKNDVNTTLNKINVATSVTNILNVLNADLTQYLTGNLDDNDIAIEPTATSGNVNSDSTIKFTKTGIAKLKNYFEQPKNPKDRDKGKGNVGSENKKDGKIVGKKDKEKCCNYTKKVEVTN